MRYPLSSVAFAASFCALAAQSPQAFETTPYPAPVADLGGSLTLAPLHGIDRAATTADPTTSSWSSDPLLRRAAQGQDRDYTLTGMFHQTYGDFMLRRERFNPMVEISGSWIPDTSVQSEAGRFDLWRLNVDIDAPVMISTDAYLKFGAFFEDRHYQTKNMPGFPDESLFSAGLHFGFGAFVDDHTLIEGWISPGSWSDWDNSTHHNDFDYPAGVLATFRSGDDMFFKFGARYNEVFEEANVLPYLGFSYAGQTVRVDILLPESLEVSLWPGPEIGFLFGVQIDGAEYHVRSSSATGRQRTDVRVQEVVVYTGAIWRLSDYVSMQGRIGSAVAGDYKLDDGDPSTPRVDGTLDAGLFAQFTFGIDW